MMITNVFLYCYIRKFKNVITNNLSRISKKDLLIAKEIIDECDMDFENFSLDELDKIENLLGVNIHIFGCNKKLLGKANLILIKIWIYY